MGRWETELPGGDFVGINAELVTRVQGRPTTLKRVPEPIQEISFAVFRRKGGHDVEPLGGPAFGWNWFTLKDPGTATGPEVVHWDGQRLAFSFPWRAALPKSPSVALDLIRDPKRDTWTGQLQREGLHLHVVLKRPTRPNTPSVFVGTWSDGANRCVHIVEANDGTFAVWSDQLRLTGLKRFSSHVQVPTGVTEYFGAPGAADLVNEGMLQVHFETFSAGAVNYGPVSLIVGRDSRSLQVSGPGTRPTKCGKDKPIPRVCAHVFTRGFEAGSLKK